MYAQLFAQQQPTSPAVIRLAVCIIVVWYGMLVSALVLSYQETGLVCLAEQLNKNLAFFRIDVFATILWLSSLLGAFLLDRSVLPPTLVVVVFKLLWYIYGGFHYWLSVFPACHF